MSLKKPLWLIFAVLIIDQIVKIIVKTNMTLGEDIPVFGLSWFRIHFVENEGMAFGMSFGGAAGKFLLSFLRIIASGLIFWFLYKQIKKHERPIIIYSLALIFAGAVGNIIDSLFYGIFFSGSNYFSPAEFLLTGGGYASFMHGKVVDMLYFPLIDTQLPHWIPVIGGATIRFFNAIFNIADSAITVGVAMLIIAQLACRSTTSANETDLPS